MSKNPVIFKLMTVAIAASGVALMRQTFADEPLTKTPQGPPAWVLEAWENATTPINPENGPPAWVLELWNSGERPVRPAGPPPWIVERQQRAFDLGLPGPPVEVVEAWQSGKGFELSGPPQDLLEILGPGE